MKFLSNLVAVLSAAILFASPVAADTAQFPVTGIFDGMPPAKFMDDAEVIVTFTSDLTPYCGKAPKGYVIEGCTSEHHLYLQNPCPAGATDESAKITCHEMAHSNGWPGTHGP